MFKKEFFPEMAKLKLDVEKLITQSSDVKEFVSDGGGGGIMGTGLSEKEFILVGVLIIAVIIAYFAKSKN